MRKASKRVVAKVKHEAAGAPNAKQRRGLEAIARIPDRRIDLSDIPELPPGAWKYAVRGKFYRPVKQSVSLRLDADVVAWLKMPGKGYQTRANRVLRERMFAELKGGEYKRRAGA